MDVAALRPGMGPLCPRQPDADSGGHLRQSFDLAEDRVVPQSQQKASWRGEADVSPRAARGAGPRAGDRVVCRAVLLESARAPRHGPDVVTGEQTLAARLATSRSV